MKALKLLRFSGITGATCGPSVPHNVAGKTIRPHVLLPESEILLGIILETEIPGRIIFFEKCVFGRASLNFHASKNSEIENGMEGRGRGRGRRVSGFPKSSKIYSIPSDLHLSRAG